MKLDRSKPYGAVYGGAGHSFEQDGKRFDQAGELIEADKAPKKAEKAAKKADEPVADVQQTQIDAEIIDQNTILRLSDVLDLSASVARQNTLGGLWDAYAVRGFAGDDSRVVLSSLAGGFSGLLLGGGKCCGLRCADLSGGLDLGFELCDFSEQRLDLSLGRFEQ